MFASRSVLMRLAVQEAANQLRRICVDFKEPIDVFQIIHEMGIELMFRPLEGKPDGFYLPQSTSRPKAGILLNSRRSPPRQRYTAAHELSHFLRKDSARVEVISEECAFVSQNRPDEEVFADFFAGHFLMPPKLVTYFFRKMGLRKGELDEKDIYRLALCMRTSYEATCNHLLHLEFISLDQHRALEKIQPQKIKSTWIPRLGHNDIWPIDQKMNDFLLLPIVDDIIQVRLAETPSTGYVWGVENGYEGVLSLEGSELHFYGPDGQIGQTGERIFTFRVCRHGNENLHLSLKRPWEKIGPTALRFNLRINSTEKEFIGHYAKDQILLAA